MNIQEWTKEQKQLALLGVMSVVVVVALINQLLLGPAKIRAAQAESVLNEKGREKEVGERMLQRDPMVRRELEENVAAVLAARKTGKLPPETSKEFWAQRRFRTIGHNLSLDLEVSIHRPPQSRYINPQGTARELAEELEKMPFWIPFSVEINARLGYHDLSDLLTVLQEEEPYASIALLKVTPSTSTPARHDVTMVVEWPVPREEAEWRQLVAKFEEASS